MRRPRSNAVTEPIGTRDDGRTYPGVLEVREKHGAVLLAAATPEQFYASALWLLKERYAEEGYWYLEPGNPPEAPSFERPEDAPEEFRARAVGILKSYERACREHEQDLDWKRRLEKCLKMAEEADGVWGPRLYQAGRLAWQLLEERSDYEYEGVSFEPLAVESEGDRLDWLLRHGAEVVPADLVPEWVKITPVSVKDLFAQASRKIGVDASALVSTLISYRAGVLARGERPDLSPGSGVTFRGEPYRTDGEVFAVGALWVVKLEGRSRPVSVRSLKSAHLEKPLATGGG